MSAKPGLQIGDRMPDFRRLDTEEEPFTLHADACGQRVLLILVDAKAEFDSAAITGELGSLPDDVLPLIMLACDPAGARKFEARHTDLPRVLADDGAIIRFLLGDTTPSAGVTAVALSSAHRLLGRLHSGDGPLGRAAAELFERHVLPDGQRVGVQAPVLVIPDVFEPSFCRELIQLYHSDNEPSGVLAMQDGKMVYEADTETKIRREHRIQDRRWLAEFEDRMQRRVLPTIQWAFQYQVTQYEGVKVVLYDGSEGGYFRAHRDNDGPDTAHRRFAMTLNLNSEEYEGGELRFPEFSRDLYKPPSGTAVVFSCSLAHEALPVTRGQRYAMVSFFYGAQDQLQSVAYENRVRTTGGWG